MKCIACGEENVQNARFCAFCGAKLSAGQEPQPAAVSEETARPVPPRVTARPLSDNPYQPHRPVIPPHPAAPVISAAPDTPEAEEEAPEPHGPRQIIKPSPQRVFLFDEEEEEETRRREQEKKKAEREAEKRREEEEDEEYGDEYEEDEEEEPRGGRIFVIVFSVLTVLALVVGVVSFWYGTSMGTRLRASMGMSSNPKDYLMLADWQLEQGSTAAASDSYHNAFKLAPEDYAMALTVGTGFENAGDAERAEQLYVYLIENHPQEDEPYDRLMALLNRQERTEEYQALLQYRAQHQTGFVVPETPAPAAPTANTPGGTYSGSVQVELSAGDAKIYYTLDDTAPNAASLEYTGPILLSAGTHHLRAVAIRDGKTSAEWSASYTVQ